MRATITLAMIFLFASPAAGDFPWPWHWWHSKSTQQDVTPSAPLAPAADPVTPFTPGPPYRIGLGDVLRISVWKEPDFTATVQVRSDGKISLPLLNDVDAVGSTPMELAAFLTGKLSKYVDDPRVTIIVSSAKPPVFYMVGEAGRKGPMPLAPNMTVLQALITTGISTFANTKKIYVLRMENGVERKLRVNYKQMVKGKNLNQNIVLKPGDMVVVP
jgi:polysaccharide biosynthesis/export protein